MTPHGLPSEIPPEFELALRQLVDQLDAVDCAWIFGSAARNQAGALSDLDVAVLVREDLDPARRAEIQGHIAGQLQTIGGPLVDVVVLNDAPPALQQRVLRDGRLVYCRQEARRVRFEVRALREFLDFQPVLERYDRMLFERAREGRLGSR
ncbi:MAG: nucleotidyltransferase domain-containing protein [Bryobacterales bacterium]|nr:nucleotidyltransferase domain-containing protein [Bryobacteraceae bacterium]MDW8354596.1 nucleotidyltransferase domain-containing protein [Bryobacterales bacterium]